MSKTAKTESSWIDSLKNKLNDFFESFDFSYENLKKIAICAAVGFGVGFVIKRYGALLFFASVITIFALYGLNYIDFIALNVDKIKLYFGFAHKATILDVINIYWAWVKNHIPLSLSFIVGFFAGYKMG